MDTTQTAILVRVLTKAVKLGASDLHFNIGFPPVSRVAGKLVTMDEEDIQTAGSITVVVKALFTEEQLKLLESARAVECTYEFEGKIRAKISAYYREKQISLTLRILDVHVRSLKDLKVSESVERLATATSGLLVIGGGQGDGRTTLAAGILEQINRTRAEHIMTLERPIEYNLVGNHSIIDQREVGSDVLSFADGLDQARSEDVDVLFISEMEDPAIIHRVLELANSGTFVIAILETDSSIHALEKILSSFSEQEQGYVRNLLADGLAGIVIQELVARIGGGMVAVHEVMINNAAIKTLILSNRTAQIGGVLRTSRAEGMMVMDHQLVNLVHTQEVGIETARAAARDHEAFETLVRG